MLCKSAVDRIIVRVEAVLLLFPTRPVNDIEIASVDGIQPTGRCDARTEEQPVFNLVGAGLAFQELELETKRISARSLTCAGVKPTIMSKKGEQAICGEER